MIYCDKREILVYIYAQQIQIQKIIQSAFQICVSSHMCLETVYSILGYWNHPLKNVVGETGCHIANLLRGTGLIQQQVHSFIMATTRYIFLFHDNILLRFNLTRNVSRISCLVPNSVTSLFQLSLAEFRDEYGWPQLQLDSYKKF